VVQSQVSPELDLEYAESLHLPELAAVGTRGFARRIEDSAAVTSTASLVLLPNNSQAHPGK
jgi:hypothetical protein